MKKMLAILLCVASLATLFAFPALAESTATAAATTAAAASQTVKVTTPDKFVTIDLPGTSWYQIISGEHNEMFSDGDCAITVDIYKNGETLPTVQSADSVHEMIYTAVASTQEYTLYVVGYAHSRDDFSAICKSINTIEVDSSLITGDMTDHTVNTNEYTIRDASYTAWVSATLLNVRSGHGTDTSIVTTLPYGSQITVNGSVLHNGTDIGWLKITTASGVQGYVSSQFVTTTQISTQNKKTGASRTLFTAAGVATPVYAWTDGKWRLDDDKSVYYAQNDTTWTDGYGNYLYTYNPVSPSASKTGTYQVVYNANGASLNLYAYTDGYWRLYDGGEIYYVVTETTWGSNSGDILYTYNPVPAAYRTGYSFTMYRSNGAAVIIYEYSDGVFRDDNYVAYYTSGSNWISTDGEIVYPYNPADSSPYRTGSEITLDDGYGNMIFVYEYSDGTWRDSSGNYYSQYNMGQWQNNSTGAILNVYTGASYDTYDYDDYDYSDDYDYYENE